MASQGGGGGRGEATEGGGKGPVPGGPSDVARIEALLREAGITEYEPRVVGQLLEVAYTTTRRVLITAKGISAHCGKGAIDENDVQLALEFSRILTNQSAERERTLRMAAERNVQPLPAIRHNFGLKLPNDRFCLLQQNVEWRGDEEEERGGGGGMGMGAPGPSTSQREPFPPPQMMMRSEPAVRQDHVVNLLKRPANDDFFD